MSPQENFLQMFVIDSYKIVAKEPVIEGNIPFSLQDYNSLINLDIEIPKIFKSREMITLKVKSVSVTNNKIQLTLVGKH